MSNLDAVNRTLVLVTGATGFVGRHLCKHLSEKGYRVRGTFRRSSAVIESLPEVEWVRLESIGPDTDWAEALDGIHYVVHLAAFAHQIGRLGESRTTQFMSVNGTGTRHLAQQSRSVPTLRRLVYISSIGGVASFSELRISETTPPQPDTDYGKSKLAGEIALRETLLDVPDWCTLRPTLVYGPGNPGNMARLLKLVMTGLPLPLASIHNHRSFVFVGNLVDAIAAVLTHPAASRKAFLISDGQDVSTPELIRILADQIGVRARLIPVPISMLKLIGKAGDSLERFLGRSLGVDSYSVERIIGSLSVDSTAITKEIGWSPPYTLSQGLRLTFQNQTAWRV